MVVSDFIIGEDKITIKAGENGLLFEQVGGNIEIRQDADLLGILQNHNDIFIISEGILF